MSVGASQCHAFNECIKNLAVTVQREDQRHIHTDSLTENGTYCWETRNGCGNLDHQVWVIAYPCGQAFCGLDGALRVVSQPRRDFQRDVSIGGTARSRCKFSHRRVKNRPENAARILDVSDSQRLKGLLRVGQS